MMLLDLFGRRWCLRILWELRETSMTSRSLRAACDEASPTVLNERLKELREAGFVELSEPGGYGLTALGRELLEALLPLHRFAGRWGKEQRS
jgi:DNA-binding HxlR family transcriptional regulator